MSHVYDDLCFESEEDVVYYKRAVFWLTCRKAVGVDYNALLLTRLVSHYMEQLHSNTSAARGGTIVIFQNDFSSLFSTTSTTTITPAPTLDWVQQEKAQENMAEMAYPTNEAGTSTLGLVNEIAAFMTMNSRSSKTSSVPMQTVSDVTAHCLETLFGDEAKVEIFYWNVVQGKVDDTNVTVLERQAMKNFCKYLCDALNGLIKTSKAAMEAYYDFEYIWKLAVQTREVRQALENLLPMESAEDSISQAKVVAWKIGCLYHLSSQSQPPPPKGETAPQLQQGRRHRLLVSAASIGLLCKLPSLSVNADSATDGTASSPVTQKQRIDENADPRDNTNSANQMGKEDNGKSRKGEKSNGTNETPPSKEKEAIIALKMILDKPVSSPAQSLPSSIPPRMIDPVIIVLESVNTLQSQFSVINLIDQDMGFALTQADIENEIVEQTRHLAFLLRVPTASFMMEESTKELSEALPSLAARLQAILSSYTDMHNLVAVSIIDEAILARLNDPIVAGVRLRKFPTTSQRPNFRFIDEFRLITEGDKCVNKIFYRTVNAVETFQAFKRPAIFCIECTADDVRITQESQTQVIGAIANLTSAGKQIQRATAAKEQMELNEWCLTLFHTMIAKPGSRLLLYFAASDDEFDKQRMKIAGQKPELNETTSGWRQIVVPLLNSIISKMTEERMNTEGANPMVVSSETGQVQLFELNDPDKRICVALIVLYYHAVETIIFHETARRKTAAHPSLLQSEAFHRAVLACSYLCIAKAFGESKQLALNGNSDLGVMGVIMMMESTPYSFLRVSESFSRAMQLEHKSNALSFYRVNKSFNRAITLAGDTLKSKSMGLPGLPAVLLRRLSYCESLLLDCCIWRLDSHFMGDGSVMKGISELQNLSRFAPTLSWPPNILQPTLKEERKDYGHSAREVSPLIVASQRKYSSPSQRYSVYVIRKLLIMVHRRIDKICTALEVGANGTITSQSWIAFRFLIRHHVEVLHDRHVDQLLLCCVYGVCKMLKYGEPSMTSFSRIIEVYKNVRGDEIGEAMCSRIVRNARLEDNDKRKKGERESGSVIDFYNRVFIPIMKNHLLKSQSLRKASNSIQMPQGDEDDSDECNSIPSQPFVPVMHGNITVQLRCGTKRPNLTAKAQGKVSRVRMLYSLGDPVRTDLDLINKALSE